MDIIVIEKEKINNIKTLWKASMHPVLHGSAFCLPFALTAFVILLPFMLLKQL